MALILDRSSSRFTAGPAAPLAIDFSGVWIFLERELTH